MTIGALAEASGVSVDTIRFYERRGLLPPPPRTAGGFRDYGPEAAGRLATIARAKALGFTLAEAATLLRLREAPEADAAEVREAAAHGWQRPRPPSPSWSASGTTSLSSSTRAEEARSPARTAPS